MMDRITIRALDPTDSSAVARVATLDSAVAPSGELMGAEVCGHLAAVLSIDGGEIVADPFRRTKELVDLLGLRAAQLRRSA